MSENKLTPEAEAWVKSESELYLHKEDSSAWAEGAIEALTNHEALKAQRLYTKEEVEKMIEKIYKGLLG